MSEPADVADAGGRFSIGRSGEGDGGVVDVGLRRRGFRRGCQRVRRKGASFEGEPREGARQRGKVREVGEGEKVKVEVRCTWSRLDSVQEGIVGSSRRREFESGLRVTVD